MRLFGAAGRPRTGRRRLSYTIEHAPELVAIVPGRAATARAAVSETPVSQTPERGASETPERGASEEYLKEKVNASRMHSVGVAHVL